MTTKPLKICFAGSSGHYGTAFASLGRLEGCEFLAYAPTFEDENVLNIERSIAKNSLNLKKYDDYKLMLEHENPDILVVDGRFCEHADISIYALLRGINVYCEKPSATELPDLEKLSSVVCKSDAKYVTMNTTRYDPCFYTAKKLVEDGVCGEITMINCQKSYKLGTRAEFYKHRETFGGIIPWVAIHSTDMIHWMANSNIKSVYSVQTKGDNKGNGDLEMASVSVFEMEDGVIAHVNADFLRADSAKSHGDDRIRIAGTKGVVEVRDNKVYVDDMTKSYEAEIIVPPRLIFEDFVNYVRTGEEMLVTTKDSLAISKTALCARDSAEKGIKINL